MDQEFRIFRSFRIRTGAWMTRMPPLLMIGSSHFVFSAPRDATAETRTEMTANLGYLIWNLAKNDSLAAF